MGTFVLSFLRSRLSGGQHSWRPTAMQSAWRAAVNSLKRWPWSPACTTAPSGIPQRKREANN